MKYVSCAYVGMMLAAAAWGQTGSGGCPSSLQVIAGTSTLIDCPLQTGFRTYQWTAKDPSWLAYLSDETAEAPHFHAPVGVEMPFHIMYRRLVFNDEGSVMDQGVISITVHPPEKSVMSDGVWRSWSRSTASTEIMPEGISDPVEGEVPFLYCVPRITVNIGEKVEIPCTGLHSSAELLAYRVELDWPPYTETKSLGVGAFNYSVRAPVIHEVASVRMLEIFAWVPGAEQEASALVEVHVVNQAPTLNCEDLIVDEAVETRVPCSVVSEQAVKVQLISQPALVQPGIYDDWPRLVIPEVGRDTSFVVTVRAFAEDQVTEEVITVIVRNTSEPMDFGIECDPVQREVYEGAPTFDILCSAIDGPTDELSWTWSAEGATSLDLLETHLDESGSTRATFHVPTEVMQDTFYKYTVTAAHADVGTSNRVIVSITVLEKPDISVVCKDSQARTGDPPLRLMCTASNSKDLPLTYEWSWTPIDLLSDVNTGTPLFEVPVDQPELVQEYEYEVTAAADFADPPDVPTPLVVTVLKDLGPVEMTCNSPIEVYEGDGDVSLGCSVSSPVSTNLVWTWELISGTTDLLIQGIDGAPPVFQTPASVDIATTWIYSIQSDDPPHYEKSEPQQVEISVLPRPILTLECPNNVEVFVGQSPQALECKVSNDQDLDLVYSWHWSPPTRLSDATTANPFFEVPLRQREYEYTYMYSVTVRADHLSTPDPVEASIDVTVLNPDVLPTESIEVTTASLDFGVVRPQGQVILDPATEQIAGEIYKGIPNAGRMILRVQDSVTVFLEQLSDATLYHSEEDLTLTLLPEWAYSESCVQFQANTQASQIVQFQLEPGDCNVIRIGGSVGLEGAAPGVYSGDMSVSMTINGIEEINTIPVSLTVGPSHKAVMLGSSNFEIGSIKTDVLYGKEQVQIWPLVAAFNSENRSASFEIHNPSLYPMEVEVTMEFGYREFEINESRLVTDSDVIGDLTGVLSVSPSFVVLQPGETKQIKSVLAEELEDKGHAGLFNFTVTPRSYLDQDQTPVQANQARIQLQVPAVYTPYSRSAQIRADLELQAEEELIIVFETDAVPFYGQVLVLDGDQELGRSDLLIITRSRVRIALDRNAEGPFTLKFVPYFQNQTSSADVSL